MSEQCRPRDDASRLRCERPAIIRHTDVDPAEAPGSGDPS